jgi:D-alanyl-D-alanine carboxypeptidase
MRAGLRRALPLIAILAVFAVACGGSSDDDSAQSGTDDDATDDDASPTDDDAADDDGAPTANPAIQALLEEYVNFSGEPGVAAAWAHGDDPLLAQAAGLAEIPDGLPFTTQNQVRVGSGTKPFTAAVIMQLVDEGKVELDGLLTDYLPEYTEWPGLTVRELLAMRSGVADYLMNGAFWLYALVHLGEPFTPEQLVQYAIDVGPEFPPGESCDYSNTNYVLLGMIIERVTGRTASQELTDRLFTPLELADTFLDEAGDPVPNLAHGYADAELAGPVLGLDELLQLLIGLIPPQFVVEGFLIDGTYLLHPSFAWTAGGVVSTPRDLGTFMRAWVRGELASDAAMAAVMDFRTCDIMGEGVQYGLGIDRVDTEFGEAYGHGGLHFGYATSTYDLPDADMTFSIVDNFVPDQAGLVFTELVRDIHDLPSTAEDACAPPDGFFGAPHPDKLEVRFRGLVNEMGNPAPAVGLSGARMRLDGVWRAYNGYGSYAYNYWTTEKRLKIETYGPARTMAWDMRTAVLDMNAGIFQSADEQGVVSVGLPNLDLALPLAMDLKLDATGTTVIKICINAVPDLAKTARYYLCEPGLPPDDVGDMLRVYGDVPMTTNEADVDAFLAMLETARCQCLDDNGDWVPC